MPDLISPTGDYRDVGKAIERAKAARSLGLIWLTSRISESGVPHCDPAFSCRLPWTLAVSGERELASAVMAWAGRELLTANGDMSASTLGPKFSTAAASYPLAMLAMGAWHLDRYDIANKIMNALTDYQNPTSGGAYWQAPGFRGSGPLEDLYPTAQLGLTGLCTGRLDVAEGSYRWVMNLWGAQPELPTKLFTRTSGGRLVLEPQTPEERFNIVTDLNGRRQAFYNPGITAAFLGRYYQATGDKDALMAANNYLRLSVAGNRAQFDYRESRQICKFGWGAAVLAEIEPGNADYISYALRMIQWFVACQEPDGRWHNSPFLDPSPTDDSDLAVTCEFVLHLSTILTALSAATSGGD